jgi:rubrerythrin
MADIRGTETERDLVAAFLRESAARSRYEWAAKDARKAGDIQAARAFEETAEQKLALAKRFFKWLAADAEPVTVPTRFAAAGAADGTPGELEAAARAEDESAGLLADAAARARAGGFPELTALFNAVTNAQRFQARRFRGIAARLTSGRAFESDRPVEWYCIKCGYVHTGEKAPQRCPACSHPQGWFEPLAASW